MGCICNNKLVIRAFINNYKFNRAYALTCPAATQIHWNKRECLHKKRVELPQDWFGTTT